MAHDVSVSLDEAGKYVAACADCTFAGKPKVFPALARVEAENHARAAGG